MAKGLLSNLLIYGLGNQIPKVISFLMLPILTPHLTPEDYGIYGVLVAYISALTAFKSLGTTVLLSNSYYKYPNRFRETWSRVFGLLSVSSIFISLVFGLTIWRVMGSESEYLWITILAYVIPVAIFDTTVLLATKLLQYSQRSVEYSIIIISASIFGIITNYIVIVELDLGYLGWIVSTFISSLVSFLGCSYVLFYKEKILPSLKFSSRWLIKKLKIALPVIPHFYSSYLITSSDRLILNEFNIAIDQIGIYNIGYTIGGYYSIIGQSLGLAIGPLLYRYFRKETLTAEQEVFNLTKALQYLLVLSAFIASIWMKEFFQLFIKNDELQPGYVFGIIIVMSYTYFPTYFVINSKLQYNEMTKMLWRVTFIAGIINVGLNVIFINYFGIMATAFATFISLLFMGYGGFIYGSVRNNFKVNFNPIYWVCLTSALLICALVLKDIGLLYKILITGLLLLLVIPYRKHIITVFKA